MAYIDVLPLADVKTYLRVDDSLTEDNAGITRMINTALSFIERETNILVYQRNVTYKAVNGCVRVYDTPIDSVVTPADYDDDKTKDFTTYSEYFYGSDTVDITLNVGYVLPADVPEELKQIALEMVDLMYYKNEKNVKEKDIFDWAKQALFNYKRFIF